MSRPVTLLGAIVLIVGAILFFTKNLGGDHLTIVMVIGVLLVAAGLVTGK